MEKRMSYVQMDVEIFCELLEELITEKLTVLSDSCTDSCNLQQHVKNIWAHHTGRTVDG
jgi:hypothetical protein